MDINKEKKIVHGIYRAICIPSGAIIGWFYMDGYRGSTVAAGICITVTVLNVILFMAMTAYNRNWIGRKHGDRR